MVVFYVQQKSTFCVGEVRIFFFGKNRHIAITHSGKLRKLPGKPPSFAGQTCGSFFSKKNMFTGACCRFLLRFYPSEFEVEIHHDPSQIAAAFGKSSTVRGMKNTSQPATLESVSSLSKDFFQNRRVCYNFPLAQRKNKRYMFIIFDNDRFVLLNTNHDSWIISSAKRSRPVKKTPTPAGFTE